MGIFKTDIADSDGHLYNLAGMIERGGVQYEVPGKTSREILSAMTKRLPGCPGLDAEALLTAMMEREALMSTGIGKGIALPHPRTPMLGEGQLPFVAIGFPANPVEWDTPDGSTVHTVFLIVSFSARQHLTTLSYINVLCQQEGFYALVKERAPRETLIAAVRDVEAAWTDGR